MKRIRILIGVTAATSLIVLAMAPAARASAPPVTYYLALGDSLATGGGATPGHGYVQDIFNAESASLPGLTLKNLACSGDSTGRMIHGGLCTNYVTGNQLGDAEQFLLDHKGQVSFITIDIGGDDVDGCGFGVTSINPACISAAMSRISSNLPVILSGLRQAGGNVPIIGMTYYDLALAAYVTGPPLFPGTTAQNQAMARQSVKFIDEINNELSSIYGQYGTAVAKVQTPFRSGDWSLTGSFNGQVVPLNVANVCNWTHMCDTLPGDPNVHANDTGHSVLAGAFEKVLRVPPSISGIPTGTTGVPYSFTFTVGGIPGVSVTRTGRLPEGMSLSSSGTLAGTPLKPGTYPFLVKAHNSAGTASENVLLDVA